MKRVRITATFFVSSQAGLSDIQRGVSEFIAQDPRVDDATVITSLVILDEGENGGADPSIKEGI